MDATPSRAASLPSPPAARICSDTPATGTAPAIRAGTGEAAVAHRDLRRDRDRVRPGQPPTGRRAGNRPHDAGRPAGRPPGAGTAIVTDKGLSGESTEEFFASPRPRAGSPPAPARKDEKQPRYFPNWLRQRVEAIIWTLKNQLGLERHGGRVPAGLWARIIQRLLALNTTIWHNWAIGAPVKRSLIAYDH